MATRTPIVSETGTHRPLDTADRLPGGAVQMSVDVGNALTLGADGGLFAAKGVTPADPFSVFRETELTQPQWLEAGSPTSWNIGASTLQIPTALLSRRCLFFVHAQASPITASAMTYYDGSTVMGVPVVAMFQMLGSGAGRLTTKPDNNVPVPTWGIYLINPQGTTLAAGATISRLRELNGVNFTSQYGIIRVYETLTLVPL